MGRGKKLLFEKEIDYQQRLIDRREIGYYRTPEFVAAYITKRMLEINPKGTSVLDPCCGKEELLNTFISKKLQIQGFDIIKYKKNYNIDFKTKDFIDYYSELKTENQLPLGYDYYIANPPYNCHEVNYIKDNKRKLMQIFSDVGVHNMYSMFISAIIDCAKKGAVIGIITSDSFLTARFHKKLREKILKQCAIHEITMCPKDLFAQQGADVRTSIILLQKGLEYQKKVRINNRQLSISEFKSVLNLNIESYNCYDLEAIILKNLEDNYEFILECPDEIKTIFNNVRLGDRYACVSGISTGNDKKYLSSKKEDPYTVPFYKNPAKNRFLANNFIYIHKDFLKLSDQIDNFIVRNKEMIFKPGITCSSMGVEFTAARLPEKCAFGVNANIICDDEEAWWLMAYLNSSLVTYMVRGVLIRSNMITSGYVSRIPLICFSSQDKYELTKLSKRAYSAVQAGKGYGNELNSINRIVYNAAHIAKDTEDMIELFNKSLIKNT
ncbi:N-6 DNA methylase [Clostridium oryzae]|uniref:site-specific DNA-methyltransferase (adenine-specific) n=1 Tax=Clostridium oryzae TaxID=1450648 RepID=A0A1V4IHU8_9CLOT|nr:N-6 DNA methylase [Clostridium oryzae]OPJ59506.1 N-6 DNA methylase [Clostridium oryzae]